MKSSATGLKVRFFKVKIATGRVCTSRSIGKRLTVGRFQDVEHASGNYRQVLPARQQHVAQVIRRRGNSRPWNRESPIMKSLMRERAGDADYWAPPAQRRRCGFPHPAPLGCVKSKIYELKRAR